MGLGARIADYLNNSKAILQSFNNPLKKLENVAEKDFLEKKFYDEEAQRHLENFDEKLYRYDPDEEFPAQHRYFYALLQDIRGKDILDICCGCGYGFTSVKLGKRGARVTGIDISSLMIQLARKNAAFNDIAGTVRFEEMSAQAMTFANESFDFVVGFGALHHLNIELAGQEISRVLRPGGRAIFIEPRIPFKFLILVRSLLPQKCFESPGGAQLSDKEIQAFGRYFAAITVTYFIFLKKLARLPIFKKFSSQLEKIDWWLVSRFPILKKLYWAFVLDFRK